MAAVIKLRPIPAPAVQGTCLCGEVRYQIDGPLGPMSHCHCSMCRSFCRTCGSVTPLIDEEMGLALCPAGNLQGEPRAKPKAHIFVGSKAQWHTITDDLPQHAEF